MPTLDQLPEAVLVHILSYLVAFEDLRAFACSCRLLEKLAYRFVKHVNFVDSNGCDNVSLIRSDSRLPTKHLFKTVSSAVVARNVGHYQHFVHDWSLLKSLKVLRPKCNSDWAYDVAKFDDLKQFLRRCPCLELVYFENEANEVFAITKCLSKRLKVVHLRLYWKLLSPKLVEILKWFPNVRLDLDCSWLELNEVFSIFDRLGKLRNVQTLRIGSFGCSWSDSTSLKTPSVYKLRLWGDKMYFFLRANRKTLRTFSIVDPFGVVAVNLEKLRCPANYQLVLWPPVTFKCFSLNLSSVCLVSHEFTFKQLNWFCKLAVEKTVKSVYIESCSVSYNSDWCRLNKIVDMLEKVQSCGVDVNYSRLLVNDSFVISKLEHSVNGFFDVDFLKDLSAADLSDIVGLRLRNLTFTDGQFTCINLVTLLNTFQSVEKLLFQYHSESSLRGLAIGSSMEQFLRNCGSSLRKMEFFECAPFFVQKMTNCLSSARKKVRLLRDDFTIDWINEFSCFQWENFGQPNLFFRIRSLQLHVSDSCGHLSQLFSLLPHATYLKNISLTCSDYTLPDERDSVEIEKFFSQSHLTVLNVSLLFLANSSMAYDVFCRGIRAAKDHDRLSYVKVSMEVFDPTVTLKSHSFY